ncbi:MAG TPA: hypothetical protein VEV41_22800 [Terriglobales bacterium]|nr:hypothetical protein [Terriglobales bacterium]HYL65459.1 hypothetical protein [Candidatus Methylomirabilis sp.]
MRDLKVVPFVAFAALFAVGTCYAQEHGDHAAKQTQAKSDAPEIFCSHKGTGQLCPGNAQMFKLSAAQKEQYGQALDSYNKAVEAASKQFLADAKAKVGLSPAELALAESWFAVGLNPEINKILATKPKK